MNNETPLGPGAEFDRIREVWRRIGDRSRGLGDDAAIVMIGATPLAISTDLAIEGQHFQMEWLSTPDIGWRAAASALSDLAAMAAVPRGVLASVGVPADQSEKLLADLMDGIAAAASSVGAEFWGGDLVQSERLLIDVVAVGEAWQPVRRAGAEAGDGLWVTGRLGGPHEAVAAWNRGEQPDALLRERFAEPVPRVQEAQWLREHGAKAMIDLSDGLVGDAGHLAAASGVASAIDAARVPVCRGVAQWQSALVGGEEYELLVALPASTDEAFAQTFEAEFALPLTHIGTVEEGSGVRVERDGQLVDLPGGFSHF